MEKVLHFIDLALSFLRESSPCLSGRQANPSHTSAALSTGGGERLLVKRQKLKPTTNKLPPLGGGLACLPNRQGRGLFGTLLVLCLLSILPLWGQGGTFPVQIIPQATPPAPIYLSDYADASTVTSPLRVQIILNDFNIANREIRLRTYFEGGGLSFQSNDLVVGANPLFLEGGVPLVLTNVELAPYFQFENITGISPNVYGQAIPEGAYKFCFEVYDVLTGSRLSRKSCAISVVFQNEPPFLVLPRNKVNVDEINPQNIVFQWTPRSINVTNVEYELSLVEIWDTQVDPQQAFLSSPPVFQVTTAATSYVYGPAEPLLLSGKNYAWRVQAKAKQGTEEIGLFKNQGYSEIFSFSYAGSCELPLGVNHEVKGSTNANVFWEDFSTDVPEYTVRYRKKENPPPSGESEGAEWFLAKTTTNTLTLWDLKAGTTYEYQVQKKCTITESDWSIEKEFTTFIADDESSVYECGISPDINLNNKEPLPNISTGDAFTAGDFPIKILEISGSNGRFTGKGYVTIPYLSSIRVAVAFTNVLINTDKQLAEGTVVTIYDPSLGNLLDVDEVIDTVSDVVDAVGELVNEITELLKDFKGTPEEISLLEELNQKQDEYINELLSNPYVSQETKDEVSSKQRIYDSASSTLIAEATENGPSPDGYGMANQIIDTSNDLQNSITIAEDQVFVGEAFVLLDKDPLFEKTFEELRKIVEYLKETKELCEKDGWDSYQDKGIVPYCIWKNAPINKALYYSKADIPFVSGIIDGAYQEAEGLALLPKMLYQIGNGINGFTFAYTSAYLACHPNIKDLNEKRLEGLLDKLEESKKGNGVWNWVKEQWYGAASYQSVYQKKLCGDAEKLRKEISDLLEYLSERENIKKLLGSVEKKLSEYFKLLEGKDNRSRYEHGKVTVIVTTIFIPGAGQLAKISKVKKILRELKNLTKGQLDELFERIRKGLAKGVGKFTTKQIDDFVLLATKQGGQTKVMLGKYLNGGPNSYIQRAGKDHTFFDLGTTKWKEAEALVNKNADEMWKINKKFIDEQKALNKEFYFSQEPWKAQSHEYLSKEAEYLIDLGAKDFQKINANTWKVIW